ncbi:calcineurin B-like protein 7 [Chenopodium quinoa]|uniref:calcineurin B-like protein 7 n=1 Tax=Chenopodium quinoa TaxID=63459 RepID=UPI000B79525C|nr:calcineurin B-like protein 7 [Chenopodium quinoa]
MKIKSAGFIIKFLNRELQMDSTEAPIQAMSQNFQLLLKNDEFTEEEVDLLYDLFNKLSNSVVKDGFIQKEELQLALFKNSMKRSLFLDRVCVSF